jgi:hypothetical protein
MGAYVAPLTGHLDAALTDYVKGFVNNALVSDIIAPRVGVGKQSGKYWIRARESQELLQKQLRATGAPAERTRMSVSPVAYFCPSHALAAEIPDEDRAAYSLGDLQQDATQDLIEKILLGKENELATMLTDTAQVTNNTTLAGADQWQDGGGKPLTVIEVGKSVIRKAGVEANFILLGEEVYTQLINHASFVERFKYTQFQAMTAADLGTVFGLGRVLVGRAVKVSEAGVASFLWGKNAVIGYVSPTASRRDVSGAKTFVWESAPGTMGGFGVVSGRHPDPTAKSDILGVDFYYDQAITAVETLYLIKNAVA